MANDNDATDKALGALITELRVMVASYAKEQVVAPLRGAGQYLRKGLIGGLIGVLAGVMAAVGGLRVAQTADVLDIERGAWSWLVYSVVGTVAIAIGAVAVIRAVRTRRAT